MQLRPATTADIPQLNALALIAKAHWGYAPAELQRWRPDLEVAPASLAANPVCVVDLRGAIIGFTQVVTDVQPWDLAHLWVHPAHMGQGIGRALLSWAQQLLREAGQLELGIDADPNAEGFYLACGARRTGQVHAPIDGQPDRVRPLLSLSICSTGR